MGISERNGKLLYHSQILVLALKYATSIMQPRNMLHLIEPHRAIIRAVAIQLPHDTICITIFASRYDMYRDTFLTT